MKICTPNKTWLGCVGAVTLFMAPHTAFAETFEAQAIIAVKSLGKETCPYLHEERDGDAIQTELYAFSHKSPYASRASDYHLVRVPCWLAAYNQGDVFVLSGPYQQNQILSFAVPTYDVKYRGDDTQNAVEAITITGYGSKFSVVFGGFDPKSLEVTEFNKSRGIGDAFTTGTWVFDGDGFTLKQFSVDATYDGKAEETTIVKFGK